MNRHAFYVVLASLAIAVSGCIGNDAAAPEDGTDALDPTTEGPSESEEDSSSPAEDSPSTNATRGDESDAADSPDRTRTRELTWTASGVWDAGVGVPFGPGLHVGHGKSGDVLHVPNGTRELEVTLTWDGGATAQSMELHLWHMADGEPYIMVQPEMGATRKHLTYSFDTVPEPGDWGVRAPPSGPVVSTTWNATARLLVEERVPVDA